MATTSRGGWKVEVTGLREVFNALEATDKAAVKEVTKVITGAAKSVRSVAAGRVTRSPLSNWGAWTYSRDGRDLSFNAGEVASGFKVRRNNFRRRGVSAGIGWDVVQTSAVGGIYEVVGNKSKVGESPYYWQGAHFVDMVGRGGDATPRSLYPAYYSVMTDGMQEQIADTVVDAARKAGLV